MDFFREIFPEDPEEDEVIRAMWIYLGILIVLAAPIYALGPVRRIRAWWDERVLPTSTPAEAPAPTPANSDPTIADKRAINQNLPDAFVEQDGTDQDMSPDDFTKPFWQYTEQDLVNMTAEWRKCVADRAADRLISRDRISQSEIQARIARQTE